MPRIDPDRGIAIVPLGALDDDPGMKAADHIFVASKCEWHDITDDLPVFRGGTGRGLSDRREDQPLIRAVLRSETRRPKVTSLEFAHASTPRCRSRRQFTKQPDFATEPLNLHRL